MKKTHLITLAFLVLITPILSAQEDFRRDDKPRPEITKQRKYMLIPADEMPGWDTMTEINLVPVDTTDMVLVSAPDDFSEDWIPETTISPLSGCALDAPYLNAISGVSCTWSLVWTAVPGVNYYNIYQSDFPDPNTATFYATSTGTGLLNVPKYKYYWIKACNPCSSFSNMVYPAECP